MAAPRVGYTTSKKVGIAVIRNRARRRLREAARAHAGLLQPGCDYVLVARTEAASLPWTALLDDLQTALLSVARKLASGEGRPRRERPATGRRAAGGPSASTGAQDET
jgi:ribonuclease P protein component